MPRNVIKTVAKNGGIELIRERGNGEFIEDLGQRATHLIPGKSFPSDLGALGDGIAWSPRGVRFATEDHTPAQIAQLAAICLAHDNDAPGPPTPRSELEAFLATLTRSTMTREQGRELWDYVNALYGE